MHLADDRVGLHVVEGTIAAFMADMHAALLDQLPLELGQRREDAEYEAAGRRGGVDLRALPGEHPQAHAADR